MSAVKKTIKINVTDEKEEKKAVKKNKKSVTKKTENKKKTKRKITVKKNKKPIRKTVKKKTNPSKKTKISVEEENFDNENKKNISKNNSKKLRNEILNDIKDLNNDDNKIVAEKNILAIEKNSVKDVIAQSDRQKIAERKKLTSESGLDLVNKAKTQRSIKLYKKIAFIFISLTVIMIVAAFYFAVAKVTITLIPNQERISNNMILDIRGDNLNKTTDKSALIGVVKLIDVKDNNNYPASGAKIVGEEVSGKVKIINNYDKNQPLVATTRLLSPDNKIFRIKKTINVPAGGSVEVDVYADKPNSDMSITKQTKFTIPGLWAGLQDKIYAQNDGPINYQKKLKKHVTKEDIDNCRRDLKQGLLTKAKIEVDGKYNSYSQTIYKIDEDSITSNSSAKVGDEVDEFNCSIEAKIIIVAFKGDEAAKLAKKKFVSSLPNNKEIINFNENSIIYSLDSYNKTEGVATIDAIFEGEVSLKRNAQIVDKNKIIGLNKQQLDAYLSSLQEIAGYEVKFSPSFIKRVPKLVDRIQVVIKK